MLKKRNKQVFSLAQNRQGAVYVMALAMMLILLTMGASYLLINQTDIIVSENEFENLRTFYYAESGIEHALAKLRKDGANNPLNFNEEMFSGTTRYSVNYDTNTKIIMSTGTKGPAVSSMEVELDVPKFTGAIVVHGDVTNVTGSNTRIYGDADIGGTPHPNLKNFIKSPYEIRENNPLLNVPYPDLGQYSYASNFTTFYTASDCSGFASWPDADVYYITGNCSIVNPGTAVNLPGSLVVEGDLELQTITGLTIDPKGADYTDYPAIIAKGNLSMIGLSNVQIKGLIYAGVLFTNTVTCTSWTWATINGPIISNGDISLVNIAFSSVNFDPNIDPPFFNGGGGTVFTVKRWSGHTNSAF